MKESLDLSIDQKSVLDALMGWYQKPPSQYVSVGGYAGTGKTTMVGILRSRIKANNSGDKKNYKVAFCSYTGRATRILRDKLIQAKALEVHDSVSTIHSLIYSPMINDKEEIIGWEKKKGLEFDLIIVDEASMVDSIIWRDLLSFGIPIIAVGDHGQLPPIGGTFDLMEKPDLRLENIHRQAENSPIIRISMVVREEGKIPDGFYDEKVIKYDRRDNLSGEVLDDLLLGSDDQTIVLCGFNNTRVKLNKHIRALKGHESEEPETGDKVICLRNNHTIGIYNGMLGKIIKIEDSEKDWYKVRLDLGEGEPEYKGLVFREQFGAKESLNYTDKRALLSAGDLFDFGYAMTVHKAQGSQAKRVILLEERFSKMDPEMWRRWLYTAVTRAESELFIFG